MRSADVVVAGGGPAGMTAAVLLARAGLEVVVVTLPAASSRVEGVSPRVVALLSRLGLPVRSIAPAVPREARWGDLAGTFNREGVVDRAAFDLDLRRTAEAEGVRVVEARAGRLGRGRLETSAGPVRGGVLIEARGRRAPRQAGRHRGPATVAIAGRSGPAGSRSAIIARGEGWMWRAPVSDRQGWTQVVVDAATVRQRGTAGAWALVAGDLPLPAAASVCAAELRLAAPAPAQGTLAVGDAAVAMDPLSGHGLFWALSSALAAVPMARAVLDGEHDLVARFHSDRVVATFYRQARIGRDFYRAAGHDGPFWRARAAWPDDAPAHPKIARPLREKRVAVVEGRLREADVLVTADAPEGTAFVAGQPIGRVLDRLGGGPLPHLRAFHDRIAPEAPPEAAATLHAWLSARGVGGTANDTLREERTT